MKRVTLRFFKTYNGIIRWLSSRSFLGIQNGGIVLFGGFLIAGLIDCKILHICYYSIVTGV